MSLDNILTFKFNNRVTHCNVKNNRVKLILVGIKFVMLRISKTETSNNMWYGIEINISQNIFYLLLQSIYCYYLYMLDTYIY